MRIPRRGRVLAAALVALALLLLTLPAAPLAAQTPCDSHAGRPADIHSREQLKQFVHCAAAHVEAVGWEQAIQDFSGSDWHDGPLALFAATINGEHLFAFDIDVAPGTELWDLRDSDGVPVVQEQARIARDFGGGYLYYRFVNPAGDRIEPKESYVLRLDYQGEPAFIGAGLHPHDTHATCAPETTRASLVYNERDVERFVACAEHHLLQGGLRAVHDFNRDPRWTSGPTYLFLLDMETLRRVAHGGNPALVGADAEAVVDPNGVHVALETRRVLDTHDDGYVYYHRLNPANGVVEAKTSYVRRILLNGRVYILGAGLYVPAAECRDLPQARDVDTRDELQQFVRCAKDLVDERGELQQFVRCAKDLVDERGELAWDLFLNHPQWIGGATYLFVLDELCRQLVHPLDDERRQGDEPRCDFRAAGGNLANRDILNMARSGAGEGWVRYRWLNPASGEIEAKHSFVIRATLDGQRVAIAAGLYESQMRS